MENKFKLTKDWVARIIQIVVLVLLFVVFWLNFKTFFVKLSYSFEGMTMWQTSKLASSGVVMAVFTLGLKYALFGSIIPFLGAVVSLIRKHKAGFVISLIYDISYAIAVVILKVLYTLSLSNEIVVLNYVSIGLLVLAIGGLVAAKIVESKDNSMSSNTKKQKLAKQACFSTLILQVLDLFFIFSIFFIPLFTKRTVNGDEVSSYSCILIDVFSKKTISFIETISFVVALILFLSAVIYFLVALSSLFSDQKKYMKKASVLMGYNLLICFAFFILGYSITLYYNFNRVEASTISFVPFILIGTSAIALSVLKGKFDSTTTIIEAPKKKKKHERVTPLIFICLFTVVSIVTLFLNIVIIKFSYTYDGVDYAESVYESGINLMMHYSQMSNGYQILAFFLVLMIISATISFIFTLVAYFSRYRRYGRVAKIAAYIDLFFVFLIGMSGIYFSIAQSINIESIKVIAAENGYTLPENFSYAIRTDAIYPLIIDVVLLGLMMLLGALAYEDPTPITNPEGNVQPLDIPQNNPEPEKIEEEEEEEEEEKLPDFDPCPAFTELDEKSSIFMKDVQQRKKSSVRDASLKDLVSFIVEYARDSRLHLSYSKEDIATFISGLGACRLTILQGMSGTGKTSLPKIFSEAILGNVDIIEVESSWKDKNELLGYYNEFSKKYTPKKFTQALYKAALNPEVPTFIVLDEMNLSRIEYYFSDFLSLMENEEDKREIKLLNIKLEKVKNNTINGYLALSEGHTLKVPSNIWFIGTANRDESTFVISDKVYDRAHTMNFNKRAPKVRDFKDPISQKFYNYETLNRLLTDAKKRGTFDAENNDIIKRVEELLTPYNISFGNRILKQIEDFVNIYQDCFEGEVVLNDAVEKILLSKVVSKLEVKVIDDKEKLVREFEYLNLHRCAEFVSKLNED